jgi:DNA-binding NarL/FixJ family response regulator
MITIAIVDDHPLIISSLTRLINTIEGFELWGSYERAESLCDALKEGQPSILLMDYHLPDQTGDQLARYIVYHYPEIKIIALTGFDKPGLSNDMLECGCMGYLVKTTATDVLLRDAILSVSEGKIYMDSSLQQLYAERIREAARSRQSPKPKLTNRELEVLKGIVDELSSQEIADKLFISKRTVDNHRKGLLLKTGARNMAGLIKFAIELRLV